ncbi:hypothetical protein [Kineococcus aurantiacus]|uniref:Uncharacterized protein n=1 Tax=Kineococcus aurantiacus TaxID=37633 RepID=A0A7Y9DJD3_9ACTN|nr:hypothetical protein [Kineococcus aurantiacus]NYD20563.1 hypothetical protein [Kineococcus aurantiacus]
MIVLPPSQEHPYELVRPHSFIVRSVTSMDAVDEALDRQYRAVVAPPALPSLNHASGPDAAHEDEEDEEEMWEVSVSRAVGGQYTREEWFDTPTMNVGVGSERVPVQHNYETSGHNAAAHSERAGHRRHRADVRIEEDWSWTRPAEMLPAAAARKRSGSG